MQVRDEVRKSVVFVCYEEAGRYRLAGTGFFLGMPLEQLPDKSAIYVVTAAHVINQIRAQGRGQHVYLRMNFRDGQARLVETDINDWTVHPDKAVDVAVVNFAPSEEDVDYGWFPMGSSYKGNHRAGRYRRWRRSLPDGVIC